MSKVVEYVLQLRDQFSPALDAAKEKTEIFQHSVTEAKEKSEGMFSALGASFALFEGFEFIKKSKEEFEQLEEANAQVKAGLESTQGAAGLTFEELEKGAAAAADKFNYTQGQIAEMQSVLLTFPAVAKETFGDATQAIFDMATRMHQDLDSTAIQVGKALQDPIRGVTALHRVGVNFSQAQMDMIKHMVEGGHAAKAQALILKELQTEFAGSAEAAAKADPLFHVRKNMEDLRKMIGELATKFTEHLAPALEWIAEKFKEVAGWMREHRQLMGAIVDILLPVAGAIGAIVVATQAWTAAQWLLDAALLNNPIGWIIAAVAAFVGVVIYLYKHFAVARGIVMGLWEVLKALANWIIAVPIKVFMELGEAVLNIFHPAKMIEHLKAAAVVVFDGAKELGTAFKKGYDEGVADFDNDHATDPNKKHDQGPKRPPLAAQPSTPASTTSGSKVSGTRNTTINVSIQNLVSGGINVHSTTIRESLPQIREAVVKVLLSAVNDSQIIADH